MQHSFAAVLMLALASLSVSACGSPPCVCPCAETALAAEPPGGEEAANTWAAAGGEDTAAPVRYAVPVTSAQPSRGPADAVVTLVVFSDFQCPFCGRLVLTINELMRMYPMQLRVVWRNLPLPFHPQAMPAAEAALEAFGQRGDAAFWPVHDRIFEHQTALTSENLERWAQEVGLDMQRFRDAMSSRTHRATIEADMALAEQLGAFGTPNSFVNGIQVMGAQPLEVFADLVESEIATAQRLVQAGTPASQVYAALTRDGLARAPDQGPGFDEPPSLTPDPAAVYRVPLDAPAPQRGPSDALVTVVMFSDFQCPFCSRVEPTLTRLLDTYGRDLRVVWMNNPLEFHMHALPAAVAVMEAFEQGGNALFWILHGKLFENQHELSRETIERLAQEAGLDLVALRSALDNGEHEPAIRAQQRLANSLGAQGTPAFFINGRSLNGAQPYDVFAAFVDEELTKARALVSRGTPRARVYSETVEHGATSPQMRPEPSGAVGRGAAEEVRVELPVPRNAPSRGAAGAPVVIQEVADYQCPFCSRAQPTVARLLENYGGRVRLVWRDLPLPFHPDAHLAAQAAREVFRQGRSAKFWAYQELLFANQRSLSRDSLERFAAELGGINMRQFRQALDTGRHRAAVDADAAAVQAVSINGTPSFVINGVLIPGARPYEELAAAVDAALAEADAR